MEKFICSVFWQSNEKNRELWVSIEKNFSFQLRTLLNEVFSSPWSYYTFVDCFQLKLFKFKHVITIVELITNISSSSDSSRDKCEQHNQLFEVIGTTAMWLLIWIWNRKLCDWVCIFINVFDNWKLGIDSKCELRENYAFNYCYHLIRHYFRMRRRESNDRKVHSCDAASLLKRIQTIASTLIAGCLLFIGMQSASM